MLRFFLEENFSGKNLVVVSNREPYSDSQGYQKSHRLPIYSTLSLLQNCLSSPNVSIPDTSIRGRIWFFKHLEPGSRSKSLRE
jgi:hypothetical protein